MATRRITKGCYSVSYLFEPDPNARLFPKECPLCNQLRLRSRVRKGSRDGQRTAAIDLSTYPIQIQT